MLRRTSSCRRRGTHAVECALVYPVFFLIVLAMVICGMGIFRYQQMAWLAREGARYASVRGDDYALETGNTAATQADIQTYVQSLAAVPDPENVTVTVTWNNSNATYRVTSDNGQAHVNTVQVAVQYNWSLELNLLRTIIGSTVPLGSTSVMPMSY